MVPTIIEMRLDDARIADLYGDDQATVRFLRSSPVIQRLSPAVVGKGATWFTLGPSEPSLSAALAQVRLLARQGRLLAVIRWTRTAIGEKDDWQAVVSNYSHMAALEEPMFDTMARRVASRYLSAKRTHTITIHRPGQDITVEGTPSGQILVVIDEDGRKVALTPKEKAEATARLKDPGQDETGR